jgi:hypothetical protein
MKAAQALAAEARMRGTRDASALWLDAYSCEF